MALLPVGTGAREFPDTGGEATIPYDGVWMIAATFAVAQYNSLSTHYTRNLVRFSIRRVTDHHIFQSVSKCVPNTDVGQFITSVTTFLYLDQGTKLGTAVTWYQNPETSTIKLDYVSLRIAQLTPEKT